MNEIVKIDKNEKGDKSSHNQLLDQQLLEQGAKELHNQLDNELKNRKGLRSLNRKIALWLGVSSIVFSGLATIFGIVGNLDDKNLWKILTPVSAAIAGSLQAALLGYPVEKRSAFHRLLEVQTESLKDELEIRQLIGLDSEYLYGVIEQLKQVKSKGALEEPGTEGQISSSTLEQIESTLEQIREIQAKGQSKTLKNKEKIELNPEKERKE